MSGLAPITIDGAPGIVAYFNAAMEMVDADKAVLAKVIFDDGRRLFYRVSDVPTPAKGVVCLRGKYSDDEPRDDSGRWTDGGGGGDAASATVPHEQTIDATRARVTTASGGAAAYIEGSPVSMRAAGETADVLAEMRAQGYTMPDKVFVQRDSHETPHGRTTYLILPQQASGSGVREGTELHVVFPGALPADADLDQAVEATFSRETPATGDPLYSRYDDFTARSTRDIVLHEMGHVQRNMAGQNWPAVERGFDGKWAAHVTPTDTAWSRAAKRVSMYAATEPAEFVAEAFVRQYKGETLAPDSAALYADLQGPVVR